MLTLTSLKSEITADKKYNELDSKSWETKLHERAVDVKFDDVLEELIPMYVSKIDALRAYLMDDESGIKIAPFTKEGKLKTEYEVYQEFCKKADEYHYAQTKEQRLLDKLACCLKEQELRKAKLVTRIPHHTTYYCDYTNGNDANDGLSADNAHSWKTINQYTTTTVRTAGDILLVRANQTHDCSGASIVCDEDGNVDNWIKIVGCDATTNDPWNDDSNVKPILDFNYQNYYFNIGQDDYWWIERLDIRKSGSGNGQLAIGTASNTTGNQITQCYVKDCDISDGNANTVEGIYILNCNCTLDGCTFVNTNGVSLFASYCIIVAKNCTFNGGASKPTANAVNFSGSIVYFDNCSFGLTTEYTSAILYMGFSFGLAVLRNCSYSGTLISRTSSATTGIVRVEDDDAVYGKHFTDYYQGVISRETASPRPGGSTSYVKMLPNVYCGLNNPLIIGEPLSGFTPKWLTKDVEYTVTVYARVGSAWDSALSASEAYLRCSYLSNASTAERTEIDSTETIANDTTWTAFTVTFTPLQTGFAYFWFYLAEYEDASEYIDVDDEPVVS